MEAEKSSGLHEGEVLAGKYRVERVLGSGGMGMVVAAHHVGLDAKVAIKLLRPEMLSNEEAVGRFAREARAAARITSEHVARIFDVGVLEGGAPYMVMEFLDGSDLGERLRRDGRLPFTQAVEFVLQACEAVAQAHSVGIVHRDLKPSNLFCVRRPNGSLCVKVLDFGISKLSMEGTQSGLTMTATAAVMGTPFYMSPEQMESARDVDARTDIWSLGIILFELIAGLRPFGGQTLPEICFKIAMHPAPRIRETLPEVPPGLEAVIARCLEKRRDDRFSTVAKLVAALAPYGDEAPSRASQARPSSRASERTAIATDVGDLSLLRPQTLSALGHTKGSGGARSPLRYWLLAGAGGLAIVAMTIFVASGTWQRSAPPAGGASSAALDASAVSAPSAVTSRPPAPPPLPVVSLVGAPEARPVETPEAAPASTQRRRKPAAPPAATATHAPAAPAAPPAAAPPSGTNPFDERL